MSKEWVVSGWIAHRGLKALHQFDASCWFIQPRLIFLVIEIIIALIYVI